MFIECSRMFIIVSTLELLLFQQFFHGRPDGKLEPSGFGLHKCHLKYTSFIKYSFKRASRREPSRSAAIIGITSLTYKLGYVFFSQFQPAD